MSKPAIVDTNILIGFYNRGLFEEEFLHLNRRFSVHFSTVTLNEFIRGAHDPVSRDIVESFLGICRDQMITPTKEQWIECGKISQRILQKKKRSKEGVLLLQNDILIALGAKDLGALLVTCDKNDFRFLTEFFSFSVEYW